MGNMTTIRTGDLYKAAFYLCYGARVYRSEGSYPSVVFTLHMNWWRKGVADIVRIVPWQLYRKKRKFLKDAALAGIYNRNELGDIAIVRPLKLRR